MAYLDPTICTPRKSESLMIWTVIAPKVSGMWLYKSFWHNRLQCKSYQRYASGAGNSWNDGGTVAIKRRLHAVRLVTPL
jgi:hypothetical protein